MTAPTTALDVKVAGGTLVDGTGAPRRAADVGVRGDRICAVGNLHAVPARRIVDATGCFVTPGFVDAHVHSEEALFGPHARTIASQGITTNIVGQDGFGFAPTTPVTFGYMRATLRGTYGRATHHEPGGIGAFLARYDGAVPVNVATLAPLGCIRMNVLGHAGPQRPSPADLAALRDACAEALVEGACGISSGLDYVPSAHASTDELVAVAEAAAEAGTPYVSHVRYRVGLLPALEEALDVGERSGAAVHVSHLLPDRAAAVDAGALTERLDAAAGRGVDVTFDSYPYTYGCTTLLSLLPEWALEGQDDAIRARLADAALRPRLRSDVEPALDIWARCTFAGAPPAPYAELVGAGLVAAAVERGSHPADLVADVLIAAELDGLVLGIPDREPGAWGELLALLCDERHMFASDGIFAQGEIHPRATDGARAYLAGVTGPGALSLERAVEHMSGHAARRFGLADRGLIAEGSFADLVVLRARDDELLIEHVLCNGVATVDGGRATVATPGRGLHGGAR